MHLCLYLRRSIQELDTQKWAHSIAFGFHREFYGGMCFDKRVQEVRCCFYVGRDGERIVNIFWIERREFLLSLRFSSMSDMKTLASTGPRGDPIATPSVCSYRAPLNWNSCPLVATLRRSTRSVLVRFRSYVSLNQLFAKALFARSCIVSAKGTLVNRIRRTKPRGHRLRFPSCRFHL